MTFFPRLEGTFEVGQDGDGEGGSFCDGGKKKAREDRVNEMASKDELNGGRKETRSGLALLIDSSQTLSFQPTEVFQSLNSLAQLFKRLGVWGV